MRIQGMFEGGTLINRFEWTLHQCPGIPLTGVRFLYLWSLVTCRRYVYHHCCLLVVDYRAIVTHHLIRPALGL